jgi:hypothetical protein
MSSLGTLFQSKLGIHLRPRRAKPRADHRHWVLERNQISTRTESTSKWGTTGESHNHQKDAAITKSNGAHLSLYFDYKYMTEVESHEHEFDCLKSIELDEKINSIEFFKSYEGGYREYPTRYQRRNSYLRMIWWSNCGKSSAARG